VPESSRHIRESWAAALAVAREALAARPAGLLTDFDGTLSPIVERPQDARLADGMAEALAALARRVSVVGVITGRGALDARARIGLERVLVVGNHGAEWLEPGATAPVVPASAGAARKALEAILERVPSLPGAEVEDKGLSATVHLRRTANPADAGRVVLAAIGDPGTDITVRRGRMSIELRPMGLGDKGQAVREVVARSALRGVLAMGDDVTDLDMFTAVTELRRRGEIVGAIIAVGGDDGEVPPEVAAAADAVVPAPEAVARLLAELARSA
jgi:trehalose 6-phosphate phosphatase